MKILGYREKRSRGGPKIRIIPDRRKPPLSKPSTPGCAVDENKYHLIDWSKDEVVSGSLQAITSEAIERIKNGHSSINSLIFAKQIPHPTDLLKHRNSRVLNYPHDVPDLLVAVRRGSLCKELQNFINIPAPLPLSESSLRELIEIVAKVSFKEDVYSTGLLFAKVLVHADGRLIGEAAPFLRGFVFDAFLKAAEGPNKLRSLELLACTVYFLSRADLQKKPLIGAEPCIKKLAGQLDSKRKNGSLNIARTLGYLGASNIERELTRGVLLERFRSKALPADLIGNLAISSLIAT